MALDVRESASGRLDTGIVGPAETVTLDTSVLYTGTRRFDDIAPFRLDVAGDSDTSNNSKLIHVVFNYCDVRLKPIDAPSIMPAEGGMKLEFSVRNSGTVACRQSRIAAVSGGSRVDGGDRYTIAPARSVSDDGGPGAQGQRAGRQEGEARRRARARRTRPRATTTA